MRQWLIELDRILRGDATRVQQLQSGHIPVPASGMGAVIILLGMFYGLCMGVYAIIDEKGPGWPQMIASMLKVPALFLLTLVVTFPSLYVFNALVGSRLTLLSLVRLLIAAIAVMMALLASFGTIVAFFSFSTESYPFMVLLNVVVFAVAGFLGLSFLLQTLHRLTLVQQAAELATAPPPPAPPPLPREAEESEASAAQAVPAAPVRPLPGALEHDSAQRIGANVKNVFRLWIIVFGLVGAQMSWVLRPFIGSGPEFAWFRTRGGNFFESVLQHLGKLLGG